MSLSAPVTIQVREYIDPTIGGAASPSILIVIIGSRYHNNGSNGVTFCVVLPAPTLSLL